jgi:hypothetical protein
MKALERDANCVNVCSQFRDGAVELRAGIGVS